MEGNYTKFYPKPYVWYSSWSTRGSRHNVRWSLDKHEPRGSNFDAVALDWHADTCWRIAYVHDANGNSEFGSLEHFKAQVLNTTSRAEVMKLRPTAMDSCSCRFDQSKLNPRVSLCLCFVIRSPEI